jgi:hypothetical protein
MSDVDAPGHERVPDRRKDVSEMRIAEPKVGLHNPVVHSAAETPRVSRDVGFIEPLDIGPLRAERSGDKMYAHVALHLLFLRSVIGPRATWKILCILC